MLHARHTILEAQVQEKEALLQRILQSKKEAELEEKKTLQRIGTIRRKEEALIKKENVLGSKARELLQKEKAVARKEADKRVDISEQERNALDQRRAQYEKEIAQLEGKRRKIIDAIRQDESQMKSTLQKRGSINTVIMEYDSKIAMIRQREAKGKGIGRPGTRPPSAEEAAGNHSGQA